MPDVNALTGESEELQEQSAATEQEAKTDEVSEASEAEQEERAENGQFKAKKSEVPEGVQKRIDKAVAKQREAERRAGELERRLNEAQAAKPAEVKTEAKPTPDKFSTYEEYVEALTDWKTDQKLAKARESEAAESKKRTQSERKAELDAAWRESEAEVKKARPDYDDVIQEAAEAINSGELPAVSNDVFAAIQESDSKAEIMYHLAKNHEDLKRLTSATTHTRMVIELGKIEAKLQGGPVQEKQKVTGTPRPPSTVNGRVRGSFDPNDPNVSTDEWFKREKERQAAKRSR